MGRLKGYFEVRILGVEGDILDSGGTDIVGERFLNVANAIGYVVSKALNNHLNGAVGQVAGVAGQTITIGYIKGGETKADTLDPAGENYVSGSHL